MFFFQRNWSPLLFISRSSSFFPCYLSWCRHYNLVERMTRFFFLFFVFLSKSPGRHAIYRRNERVAGNAKFHLSYNIPLPRRADVWLPSPPLVSVRTGGRTLTKFSRMDRLPTFLSYGAPLWFDLAPGALIQFGTSREGAYLGQSAF